MSKEGSIAFPIWPPFPAEYQYPRRTLNTSKSRDSPAHCTCKYKAHVQLMDVYYISFFFLPGSNIVNAWDFNWSKECAFLNVCIQIKCVYSPGEASFERTTDGTRQADWIWTQEKAFKTECSIWSPYKTDGKNLAVRFFIWGAVINYHRGRKGSLICGKISIGNLWPPPPIRGVMESMTPYHTDTGIYDPPYPLKIGQGSMTPPLSKAVWNLRHPHCND